jgi:hypothetical protein
MVAKGRKRGEGKEEVRNLSEVRFEKRCHFRKAMKDQAEVAKQVWGTPRARGRRSRDTKVVREK